jgi:hypothetical protein
MHQITKKYTQCPQTIPNGRKIDQHLPLQDTPKFTQIGLKIHHLATPAAFQESAVVLDFGAIIGTESGLPDFSWYMIPKPEKMYQMNSKCTKWS